MMGSTSQDGFEEKPLALTSTLTSTSSSTTTSSTAPLTIVTTTESSSSSSSMETQPKSSPAPAALVSHHHHHSSHHHNESSSSSSKKDSSKKRMFSKELRCMMYGFGDDQNPYTETVDMLEDLVIQFIGDISLKALEIGRSGRVTVEDVMYLVRRDQRKYSRVKDLLSMNEELKKARKAFDEVKYVQSV